jgi:hypothetical protein
MLYLYLDESGDLGFDFVNKKPSAFFTICVMAVKGQEHDRAIAKAVKAVIRRKLPTGGDSQAGELKDNVLPLEIKKYFFRKVRQVPFGLHAVTLNKKSVYCNLAIEKERIYNYLARQALTGVNFSDAAVRVIMTVDRSKPRQGILEFNACVLNQVRASIDPLVPLDIFHVASHESPGLQATDMFVWGIFRKYERGDNDWYEVFKHKLHSEKLCLP